MRSNSLPDAWRSFRFRVPSTETPCVIVPLEQGTWTSVECTHSELSSNPSHSASLVEFISFPYFSKVNIAQCVFFPKHLFCFDIAVFLSMSTPRTHERSSTLKSAEWSHSPEFPFFLSPSMEKKRWNTIWKMTVYGWNSHAWYMMSPFFREPVGNVVTTNKAMCSIGSTK